MWVYPQPLGFATGLSNQTATSAPSPSQVRGRGSIGEPSGAANVVLNGFGTAEDSQHAADQPRRPARFGDSTVIAVLLLALAGTGFVIYYMGGRLLEDAARSQLEAVARLKESLVQACIADSMDDFLIWSGNPEFRRTLLNWHEGASGEAETRRQLVDLIARHSKTYRFAAVTIRDAMTGSPLLSTPEAVAFAADRARMLAVAVTDAASDAPLSAHAELRGVGAMQQPVSYSVFAAIVLASGTPFIIQVDIDPLGQISRILDWWPGVANTAEILLVQAASDGEPMSVLNALASSTTPSNTRTLGPLEAGTLASGLAHRPDGGQLEGVDDRGHRAFAFAKPVAGTRWILVTKLDASEVFGELNRLSELAAFSVIVLFTLGCWWAAQRRNWTKREWRMYAERAEQAEQLAELTKRVVTAQEEQRQRLAMELHDRTAANLAAIQLNLKAIARLVPGASEGDRELLKDTGDLLGDSVVSIREFCDLLHPPALDYAGAAEAISASVRQFSRRTGIAASFVNDGYVERATREVESALYRIVQEALVNVAKHANATNIEIRLARQTEGLCLTVEDDGVGFDPDHALPGGHTRGHGLLNMRERAVVAGGLFTIHSRAGHGTKLQLLIR